MAREYSANLPQKRYTGAQIRINEALVAKNLSIEMYQLMEDAGRAMFDMVADHFASTRYRHTVMTVLCGYGNNGGDGYVVARLAKTAGWRVRLVQVGDGQKISGDALKAKNKWLRTGGAIETVGANGLNLDQDSLIIDALLGTGLGGDVRSPFTDVIRQVNTLRQQGRHVVCSVDIPSGLNADTGQPMGCAIAADMTCTFVAVKQGLLTGSAGDYCGQLVFCGLGIEEAFTKTVAESAYSLDQADINAFFPRRRLSSHKGSFGHVLFIGGNKGMSGAIRMAAMACLRTGAGLVSVLTHGDNESLVAAGCPEIMVTGVALGVDISRWLQQVDVIVFGPGAGQDQWSKSLLDQVCQVDKAKVIDADGLNLLARSAKIGRPIESVQVVNAVHNCIVTPHPKEASRLLKTTVAGVQADRFAAVKLLAKGPSVVALLKGYGTLVSDGQQVYVNPTGNPGMATAGMGDVLSGILGGLLAQGHSLMDAATVGAWIHGAAADMAAKDGERGLMATDLYPHIRALVNI
ncbi:MAG: hydroxyethylthiazole kinase-like uncharacterized protein yjeF [Phenylobacterium sp.]|jgi:hydroxyethylthiazole kinase-like uncharacterized protein yjeF